MFIRRNRRRADGSSCTCRIRPVERRLGEHSLGTIGEDWHRIVRSSLGRGEMCFGHGITNQLSDGELLRTADGQCSTTTVQRTRCHWFEHALEQSTLHHASTLSLESNTTDLLDDATQCFGRLLPFQSFRSQWILASSSDIALPSDLVAIRFASSFLSSIAQSTLSTQFPPLLANITCLLTITSQFHLSSQITRIQSNQSDLFARWCTGRIHVALLFAHQSYLQSDFAIVFAQSFLFTDVANLFGSKPGEKNVVNDQSNLSNIAQIFPIESIVFALVAFLQSDESWLFALVARLFSIQSEIFALVAKLFDQRSITEIFSFVEIFASIAHLFTFIAFLHTNQSILQSHIAQLQSNITNLFASIALGSLHSLIQSNIADLQSDISIVFSS